jgi:hypothetical protein
MVSDILHSTCILFISGSSSRLSYIVEASCQLQIFDGIWFSHWSIYVFNSAAGRCHCIWDTKGKFFNACISDADLVRQDLIVAWSFWKREKRETPRTIYMHQFELPGEDVDSTQSTPIQASPDELGATQ